MESHFAKFNINRYTVYYYEHNVISIPTAKHMWLVQQSLNRIWYYTDTHAYRHTHTFDIVL